MIKKTFWSPVKYQPQRFYTGFAGAPTEIPRFSPNLCEGLGRKLWRHTRLSFSLPVCGVSVEALYAFAQISSFLVFILVFSFPQGCGGGRGS